MRSGEKGFSLIEFLLVLVIVLILVALAVPQFTKKHQEDDFTTYFGAPPPTSERECMDEAPFIEAELDELQRRTTQGDVSARAKATNDFKRAMLAAQLCPDPPR